MTKRILTVISLIGVSYLAASFIALSFDVSKWQYLGRSLFGIYALMAIIFAVLIPKE